MHLQTCCFANVSLAISFVVLLAVAVVVAETRDLTKPRPRRQQKRQKAIRLMSKTTALHVYISQPPLHNCDVK